MTVRTGRCQLLGCGANACGSLGIVNGKSSRTENNVWVDGLRPEEKPAPAAAFDAVDKNDLKSNEKLLSDLNRSSIVEMDRVLIRSFCSNYFLIQRPHFGFAAHQFTNLSGGS